MSQDMASECKGENSDFPSIVTSASALSCGGTLSCRYTAVFASTASKQIPSVCLQVRNFTHNKYYLRLRKWKVKESFICSKCQVQIMTAGIYQSWAQSSPSIREVANEVCGNTATCWTKDPRVNALLTKKMEMAGFPHSRHLKSLSFRQGHPLDLSMSHLST